MTADDAYGVASQGVGLLWRGDFQNARQMLTALANRADSPARKPGKTRPAVIPAPKSPVEEFNIARQGRAQRARTLGMLLIPLGADYVIPLRRAPDIQQACMEAYGAGEDASV
ncbi:MAG: methyltransferase, partial [Burkholderiales bacterium]|nr:methyltransferase [Burkholderiales bacterium]